MVQRLVADGIGGALENEPVENWVMILRERW
jgi:hypothetical protein